MKMIIYLFDQQLRKTETNECGLLFFYVISMYN